MRSSTAGGVSRSESAASAKIAIAMGARRIPARTMSFLRMAQESTKDFNQIQTNLVNAAIAPRNPAADASEIPNLFARQTSVLDKLRVNEEPPLASLVGHW